MSSGEKGTDLGVTSKAAWLLKRGRFHRGLSGGGSLGMVHVIINPIWVFPKIGVPQNGWFRMENLIKMNDLGVPLVLETSIYTSRLVGG